MEIKEHYENNTKTFSEEKTTEVNRAVGTPQGNTIRERVGCLCHLQAFVFISKRMFQKVEVLSIGSYLLY